MTSFTVRDNVVQIERTANGQTEWFVSYRVTRTQLMKMVATLVVALSERPVLLHVPLEARHAFDVLGWIDANITALSSDFQFFWKVTRRLLRRNSRMRWADIDAVLERFIRGMRETGSGTLRHLPHLVAVLLTAERQRGTPSPILMIADRIWTANQAYILKESEE